MAYWRGRYLYRSKRKGRRVVSEYLGCGELARCLAQLDTIEAEQRAMERAEDKAEREAQRALDAKVEQAGDLLRQLTRAVLLASGYHTHKGQWRRRRHGSHRD